IILGGFSQGGVITYTLGLTTQYQLGGIIALSCYFPSVQKVVQEADKFNKLLPIFAAHGVSDPIIPYQIAESTHQILERFGFDITWYVYPMEHSLCQQEVIDLSNWLNERCISAN
ncbi:MAG: carboxylesterase, partial [Burkholderiales bacterium]|nr:carboxylesterase [Burkholderiales bacterium]